MGGWSGGRPFGSVSGKARVGVIENYPGVFRRAWEAAIGVEYYLEHGALANGRLCRRRRRLLSISFLRPIIDGIPDF